MRRSIGRSVFDSLPMINNFYLHDFKGHQLTKLSLGRFTVLVGDNASGKTSALDGIALLAALDPNPITALRDNWYPPDLLRRGASGPIALSADGTRGGQPFRTSVQLQILPAIPPKETSYTAALEGVRGADAFAANAAGSGGSGSSDSQWVNIGATLGTATLYRLRADRIAAAAIIDNAGTRIEPDGTNTAVALAAMKLANDEAFGRIEEAMRKLIPSVQRIRVLLDTGNDMRGKIAVNKLAFDFRGAPGVPAHGASHGTLIVLALLAVLHGPNRPNVILLDDFDHALHPRAQIELVRMIKALLAIDEFRDLQVVATTHSPYTLDELDPSEIHAFALSDEGTVESRPLSEHPEAAKLKGTLTAGQLWSLDPEREWVLRG